MNISVIICTFNRCESLKRALQSVAESRLPESLKWEVLVLDNNSGDLTRAVVEDYCQRYPGRFRYVFEPTPGKSHALNRGIREARGKVLAFVDDDATVSPVWLERLTAGLHDGKWVGSGGRILPQWSCPPPWWLPKNERYCLAPLVSFDLGSEAGPLTEAPYGANMAFRKEVFESYGTFRTDLGPRPGGGIQFSEDSEFGQRLLSKGEPLKYVPEAIVYHPVAPERLRKKYFLDWWFAKARADVQAFGPPAVGKFWIGGVPVILFRRLAVQALQWTVAVGEPRRFIRKTKVWFLAGQILGCYHQARRNAQRRQLRIHARPHLGCFYGFCWRPVVDTSDENKS